MLNVIIFMNHINKLIRTIESITRHLIWKKTHKALLN